METKRINFSGYSNAYECRVDNMKLVLMADFGPRILHLSIGGKKNLLFVDEGKKLRYHDWICYGGSRIWLSPETRQSYSPDNAPCEVSQEKGTITVKGHDPLLEMNKSFTVSGEKHGFRVSCTVENTGDSLYYGSIWSLTCMRTDVTVFFPWGSGNDLWDTKKIIYWRKWMDHKSTIGSKQYVQGDDLFIIKPAGEEGKVGTAGYEGFIGVTSRNGTFIKKFDRNTGGTYPDDNCAVECYTSSRMVELETLGPLQTFYPQTPVTHTEHWILADREVNPEDGKEVRSLL
ncbi:MAG: hypothetical protein JW969_12790 [Spirochaetales bacterium]|nr:hypothetical protein [Spirochaetales bacterium]